MYMFKIYLNLIKEDWLLLVARMQKKTVTLLAIPDTKENDSSSCFWIKFVNSCFSRDLLIHARFSPCGYHATHTCFRGMPNSLAQVCNVSTGLQEVENSFHQWCSIPLVD